MINTVLLPDKFKSRKLKIGVTGGIGAGKTLFCEIAQKEGFPVLKADEIAKDLMQYDDEVKKKIIELFGETAYEDRKLNNAYIASLVFTDTSKLEELNKIVHPHVISTSEVLLNEKLREKDFVFYEAALIFEAQMQPLFDVIVVVLAGEDLRVERVSKRSGLSTHDTRLRMNVQRKDYVDELQWGFTITNDGSVESFQKDVRQVIDLLLSKVK